MKAVSSNIASISNWIIFKVTPKNHFLKYIFFSVTLVQSYNLELETKFVLKVLF